MGGTANACRSAAVDGDSTPPPAAPARRRSSSAPPGSRPAGQCRQSSGSLTRPDSPCSPAGAPWESRAISRTRTSWKKRICGNGGKRMGQIVRLLTRRSSSSLVRMRSGEKGRSRGTWGLAGAGNVDTAGAGGYPLSPVPKDTRPYRGAMPRHPAPFPPRPPPGPVSTPPPPLPCAPAFLPLVTRTVPTSWPAFGKAFPPRLRAGRGHWQRGAVGGADGVATRGASVL